MLSSYKSPRAPKPSEQIFFINNLEKSAKLTLSMIENDASNT